MGLCEAIFTIVLIVVYDIIKIHINYLVNRFIFNNKMKVRRVN